ncbi:MAG: hypothetical protein IKG87_02770 [Clostridia bacterium]|nr:hypothetical protein [Clostridia bacterium]
MKDKLILLPEEIESIAIDNLEIGEVVAEITSEEIYVSREIYAARIVMKDEE